MPRDAPGNSDLVSPAYHAACALSMCLDIYQGYKLGYNCRLIGLPTSGVGLAAWMRGG